MTEPPRRDRAAADPFPAPLRRFVDLFNGAEFWESHEVLEGPWREKRSAFYHGLILWASAWVHVQRDNAHGIQAQIRKAHRALDGYPDAYLGVDVAAIRSRGREVLEVVARVQAEEAANPDPWIRRLTLPRLELDPVRLLGDEAELA
ncbi:MAG: DUF309 domain-containing protein [Gemmatimonadales bacterium]|nr:MAG: DUF309 domain-containing protein [Gemmatimonadales bacterium]